MRKLFCILTILLASSLAYAQRPDQIELPCPSGSSPTWMGQSYDQATGKYRQWQCVNSNGIVTQAITDSGNDGQVYNVKAYGAKDDCSVDATAAVQAAFTAAGSGTVFFPSGCFLVSAVNITALPTILGTGRGSSIIKITGTGFNVNAWPPAPVAGGTISGIGFDMTDAPLNACAVTFNPSLAWSIRDNAFYTTGSNTACGIQLTNPTGRWSEQYVVTRNKFFHLNPGIELKRVGTDSASESFGHNFFIENVFQLADGANGINLDGGSSASNPSYWYDGTVTATVNFDSGATTGAVLNINGDASTSHLSINIVSENSAYGLCTTGTFANFAFSDFFNVQTGAGSLLCPGGKLYWNGVSSHQSQFSAGTLTYTFTFPYASTPNCIATDVTAANPIAVSPTATSVTFSGTGTDVFQWACQPSSN